MQSDLQQSIEDMFPGYKQTFHNLLWRLHAILFKSGVES